MQTYKLLRRYLDHDTSEIDVQNELEEGVEHEHTFDSNIDVRDHKEEDNSRSQAEIDLDVFKTMVMMVMLICIAFGLIPKYFKKCRESTEILSFLQCFSAGLFLAMALLHMMPEAQKIYHQWTIDNEIERAFPLPYLMFFLGYVLILAIDKYLAHLKFAKKHKMENAEKRDKVELAN